VTSASSNAQFDTEEHCGNRIWANMSAKPFWISGKAKRAIPS
jgi:hypothetical protein